MRVGEARAALDQGLGDELHGWLSELYPICRSITGPGIRQTLAWIAERTPTEIREVPSGTAVLDWEVPREWTLREAWIKGPDGSKVVDVADHALHLVSYSVPFRGRLPREALEPHLHSLPDQPDLIPYRTSYYVDRWGFCLPHRLREQLPDGEYEVLVDTDLAPGHLAYGELVLPGRSAEEILLSCHVCHPQLANDNLSGLVVAVALARALATVERRHTVRMLFIPGTIGAITWLAKNASTAGRIRHGLVLANLGDPGAFHYKQTQRGDAAIDRAVAHVLGTAGARFEIEPFVPYGYDERQYCSPGFDLPVGSLTRTPYGRFPEYHTSADDPDFVQPAALAESVHRYLEVVEVLEEDRTYRNLAPQCEPRLGPRGLYRTIGGSDEGRERELAILWVLNQSTGDRSLLDIAERAGIPFGRILEAADALAAAGLLGHPAG